MTVVFKIEKKFSQKSAKSRFFGYFAPKTLINPKKGIFLRNFITCDIEIICGSLPDISMIHMTFFGLSAKFGQHLLTKSFFILVEMLG